MRKTRVYRVETEGRDKGKIFFLEEMPALKAEKWATRAFLAVSKAGGDISGYEIGGGWASLAQAGYQALGRLAWTDAEPLLDELLSCVSVIPDPAHTDMRRALVESDFEEIQTVLQLRFAVFNLHADFLQTGGQSTPTPGSTTSQASPSPNMSTSPPQSGPVYHPARRRSPNSARS